MSEWWTYRLHDFLMFSPRTYARMFELYNEAIWPINALAAMIAFALLFIAVRMRFPRSSASMINSEHASNPPGWQHMLNVAVFAYFAIAHAWIAIVFMREHYAPIFWAAEYFAIAFIAQATLFALAAAIALCSRDAFGVVRSTRVAALGVSIVSLALLAHPTVLLAMQNNWMTIEPVGIAPDPTAMSALGFLLLIRPTDAKNGGARIVRYLWRAMIVVAIAWCIVSLLTLIAMHSYLAFAPAITLLLWIISTFRYCPIK
jgi:hypothetical protein